MGLAHIVFSENSSLLRFFKNIAYNATEYAFLVRMKYSAFTTREYKFTPSSSSHRNDDDILCFCPCITSEVFEPSLKWVGPNTSWNLPFQILHGPPMKYVDLQFHWSLCTFKLIIQLSVLWVL